MDTYSDCMDEKSEAWEDNYFTEATVLVSSTAGGNI